MEAPTTATTSTPRERVATFVESDPFQRTIIALIVINAIVLGLETYPGLMDRYGDLLAAINGSIVAIFVVEIVLRIYAHRGAFFKDGWSLFDLFVVIVALIPVGSTYAVLRVLRLLRVLRQLSSVRAMRVVVNSLGAAIPGILSIGALLFMVVYVFAVSSTTLFAHRAPEYFGDLWISTASLFRIMVADGWSDVVTPMGQQATWVFAYFILFTVLTTFIVLNLFVAVTVDAMNRRGGQHDAHEEVLAELRAIREQLASVQDAADRRP